MQGVQKHKPTSWQLVSSGPRVPQVVNAIIQITKGSKVKYELDKETGMLKMDRVLYSPMHYPANYGFIPRTYFQDGDPLDILVICSEPLQPMCLLEARVVGVMKMIDGGEGDDKIIAVAHKDMLMADYKDISEIPKHLLSEIHNFFSSYKILENKEVIVKGFENKVAAYKIVEDSILLYKQKFEPK